MMLRVKRIALLASIVAIVLVGLVADQFLNGPDHAAASPPPATISSVLPTSAATPEPPPTTQGSTTPPCTAQDLALAAGGWQGATASMAGGATLIGVAPEPCHLAGKPGLALFAKGGVMIANGEPAERGTASNAVELSEGDVAWVTTVWSNWCGEPPIRPLFIRLSLPDDGGDLEARVLEGPVSSASLPLCDSPCAPSSIGVRTAFATLPPFDPNVEPEACGAAALAGYLGPWGAGLGNYYASAFLLNAGGVDCLLQITPPLELRDADGKRLASGEQRDPNPTIVLPAGWVAVARIDFANWCRAVPKLPFEFELTIGAAPVELVPATERSEIQPPSCISPGATPPPVLGYESPFAVPGLSEP